MINTFFKTEADRDLWLKLNAEYQIESDKKSNCINALHPRSMQTALDIAKNQLAYDEREGKLRISLEEYLTLSFHKLEEILRRQRYEIFQKLEDPELKDLLYQLEFFLNNRNSRNQYISNNEIKLYVRKAVHCVNGTEMHHFIDIANIEVYEPNQGVFTKTLNAIVSKYHDKNIFIESVLNPIVDRIVTKHNFKKQQVSEETYNFYLLRNI